MSELAQPSCQQPRGTGVPGARRPRAAGALAAALRSAAPLLLAASLGLGATAARAEAAPLHVAWKRDGAVQWRQLADDGKERPAPAATQTPLGSLWKLFVYAYAVDRDLPTPDYTCTGGSAARRKEELYCCTTGGRIERDAALVRSCGLFFEPERLGISAADWRRFWAPRLPAPSHWLADLGRLRPATRVPVASLLDALESVPAPARDVAQRALLGVVLEGAGRGTVGHFGASLGAKTFTWTDRERPDTYFGGAAGWLQDGTPVWFASRGSSAQVLQQWAPLIARTLPVANLEAAANATATTSATGATGAPQRNDATGVSTGSGQCVVVEFFDRYPLLAVSPAPETGGQTLAAAETASAPEPDSLPPARPGALHGPFRVDFANGNTLTLRAGGDVILQQTGGAPRLTGRFDIDTYVARVLDREADPRQTEAAKALAIAARTYLLQNARSEGGCLRIADSSNTQRVSPNPPSATALALARWTRGLILRDVAVRYHRDTGGTNVLGWSSAVEAGRKGALFDEILAAAYPGAPLGNLDGASDCQRLPAAETWLASRAPAWRRRLAATPGFEMPAAPLTVCQIEFGHPRADTARGRLFVRGLRDAEDRISLAHEFLHVAFRFHPDGQNEAFVEALARQIAEER